MILKYFIWPKIHWQFLKDDNKNNFTIFHSLEIYELYKTYKIRGNTLVYILTKTELKESDFANNHQEQ